MKVEHSLAVYSKCPVDDRLDEYEFTITTNRMLPVEDIHEAIKDLTAAPVFQEKLTEDLAIRLRATVCSIGFHSGVKTICTAG